MSTGDERRRSALASQIYQELLSDVGMGVLQDEPVCDGKSVSEESTSLASESVGPRPTLAAVSASHRRGSRQSSSKQNTKSRQIGSEINPSKANEKCINTESCVVLTREERQNQKKVWERRLKKAVSEMQRRQETKELRSEVNRLSDEVRQLKMQFPSPYQMMSPPMTSPHPNNVSPQIFIQQHPNNQNFSSPVPTQLVGYAIDDGWSAGRNNHQTNHQTNLNIFGGKEEYDV